MIGVYDYTVILTYSSLLSASIGIAVTLSGRGYPYIGIFFLLFCGLCDAFDGRVASKKKNRSEEEKRFGIQIDSLSDLVAFGVLPACIGFSLLQRSPFVKTFLPFTSTCWYGMMFHILCYVLLLFYVLASLIRLAYFNVTEEERQKKEKGKRKMYTGLPVTSSSILFPTLFLGQFLLKVDLTPVYFLLILATGFAFLAKFQIKKLEMKGILFFALVGAIEFILLVVLKWMK